SPLPEPMKSRLPSGDAATTVGYHAVGLNPSTRLYPDLLTSTKATLLLSELATKSTFSSGESANAEGVVPGGACGVIRMLMASSMIPFSKLKTYTASSLPHETKRRLPSLVSSKDRKST